MALSFTLLVSINTAVVAPGSYSISVDGVDQCNIYVAKEQTLLEERVSIPGDAKLVSVTRRSNLPLIGGLLGVASRTFEIVRMDALTEPLRRGDLAKALHAFPTAADNIARDRGWTVGTEHLGFEIAPAVPVGVLASTEARLGFSLDAELKSVLEKFGRVRVGSSYMISPEQYALTEEQFVPLWGDIEEPAPETIDLFRSSTMIWVEAGDGYGAILYQPGSYGPCKGRPAYWRIHQDYFDEPRLVTRQDGTCGSLSDAFFHMFVRSYLEQLEDNASTTHLLVDGTTSQFAVWLETDGDKMPRLRPDWTKLC